jgi:biopolymer transport protein ExbD
MAEINMVPFTDVVLVLLVIFMVTTPFLFQGAFQVNLPKVASPSVSVPEAVTLAVTSSGKVLLNGVETPLEGLESALKSLLSSRPGATVLIEADRDVSHGTVMAVMSKAYSAGIPRLSVAVEQDPGAATSPTEGKGSPP